MFLFCLNPGWFLLSSSEHLGHSSVAQVFSEWMHPKEMVCFSLWYNMDSRSEKRGGKQNCTTWDSEWGGVLMFILFSFLTDFLRKCEQMSFRLESPASLCKNDLCQSSNFRDRLSIIQVNFEVFGNAPKAAEKSTFVGNWVGRTWFGSWHWSQSWHWLS